MKTRHTITGGKGQCGTPALKSGSQHTAHMRWGELCTGTHKEEVSVLTAARAVIITQVTTKQYQAHSHQQLQLQHWQHLTLLGSSSVEDVVVCLHHRVPVRRAGHIHKDLQQQRSCINSGLGSSSEVTQHLTQHLQPCHAPGSTAKLLRGHLLV